MVYAVLLVFTSMHENGTRKPAVKRSIRRLTKFINSQINSQSTNYKDKINTARKVKVKNDGKKQFVMNVKNYSIKLIRCSIYILKSPTKRLLSYV